MILAITQWTPYRFLNNSTIVPMLSNNLSYIVDSLQGQHCILNSHQLRLAKFRLTHGPQREIKNWIRSRKSDKYLSMFEDDYRLNVYQCI